MKICIQYGNPLELPYALPIAAGADPTEMICVDRNTDKFILEGLLREAAKVKQVRVLIDKRKSDSARLPQLDLFLRQLRACGAILQMETLNENSSSEM